MSKQSPVRAARLSFTGDINKRLALLFPFLFLFFAIKKKKKPALRQAQWPLEKEKRTLCLLFSSSV